MHLLSEMAGSTVCYIFLQDFSALFVKGCLVDRLCKCDRDRHLYKLHSQPSMEDKTVEAGIEVVDAVFSDDYQYLRHISDPRARFDVFCSPSKLRWAKRLKTGDQVYARSRLQSSAEDVYSSSPVYIISVGQTKIGFKFHVENCVSIYYNNTTTLQLAY